MIQKAATWITMIRKVGNVRQKGQQIGQFFRYYVYETLAEEGVFEYLRERRSYEEIADKFGFIDKDYTQRVLNVLTTDKNPLLVFEDGKYQSVPHASLPTLSELADQTSKSLRNFTLMAKAMAHFILPRMRNQIIEFPESFALDGRNLLTKFDTTLGSDIYTTLRNVSFARLSRRDLEDMRGKQLLEVGCGSGRETAELWLRFDGNIHITGVDPVESLLNLARERFSDYLDEMRPGHAPLTIANRPTFYAVDATKLPFDDNTFDAAFHAFVLHWVSDPEKAIKEIVRVLKPGGIVFGVQPVKPTADNYFDLVVQTSDSYGYFTKEQLQHWYAQSGVNLDVTTPMVIFYGHKPGNRR
jgi:ubiquinone/menaquinone biosynthesis C-methylase UbiE